MQKFFLETFVLALIVSAAIAIYLFLFKGFSHITTNVLFTVMSVGGYSLTALAAASLLEKQSGSIMASGGISCSVLGFVLTNLLLWGSFFDTYVHAWQFTFILMIASVAFGHACLMLHIRPRNFLIKVSLYGTLLAIFVIAAFVSFLVLTDFRDLGEVSMRVLGVFAVLNVLGTILTPVLNKIL